MTSLDSVTDWTTNDAQHDERPPTVTAHRVDTVHQHSLTTAGDVIITDQETTTSTNSYYLDIIDCMDFRSAMSNHCSWTGNGSSFGEDSSSSATAEVVGSHNFWTLLLLVFPVLTVFGNVLVVLGVYHEHHGDAVQNVTHCEYFGVL